MAVERKGITVTPAFNFSPPSPTWLIACAPSLLSAPARITSPQARGAPFRGRGAAPHQKRPVPGPAFPQNADKPRREAILDLSKYVDERIRVKFTGGREGKSPSLPLCRP